MLDALPADRPDVMRTLQAWPVVACRCLSPIRLVARRSFIHSPAGRPFAGFPHTARQEPPWQRQPSRRPGFLAESPSRLPCRPAHLPAFVCGVSFFSCAVPFSQSFARHPFLVPRAPAFFGGFSRTGLFLGCPRERLFCLASNARTFPSAALRISGAPYLRAQPFWVPRDAGLFGPRTPVASSGEDACFTAVFFLLLSALSFAVGVSHVGFSVVEVFSGAGRPGPLFLFRVTLTTGPFWKATKNLLNPFLMKT